MIRSTVSTLLVLFSTLVALAERPNSPGKYTITSPPTYLNLDSFYTKHVSASGYPVVGSEKVNDYALKETAYLIDLMLAHRPEVRKIMIANNSRCVVMAHNEYTTDIH